MNINNPTRLEALTAKLKAYGYRLTPQRLAVLRILADSREHPSVEQIYRQVSKDFPTTSLATIYNTLECLKGLDEVLELPLGGGGSRYDGRSPDPHPHLRCTVCHRIEDLAVNLGDAGLKAAAARGYAQVRQRLEFYGICPRCQHPPPADHPPAEERASPGNK